MPIFVETQCNAFVKQEQKIVLANITAEAKKGLKTHISKYQINTDGNLHGMHLQLQTDDLERCKLCRMPCGIVGCLCHVRMFPQTMCLHLRQELRPDLVESGCIRVRLFWWHLQRKSSLIFCFRRKSCTKCSPETSCRSDLPQHALTCPLSAINCSKTKQNTSSLLVALGFLVVARSHYQGHMKGHPKNLECRAPGTPIFDLYQRSSFNIGVGDAP